MAGVNIDIEAGKTFTRLRRSNGTILDNAPQIEEDLAKDFADTLEETIKQSVRDNFDRFTGRLHDNVEAKPKKGGDGARYEVSANAYNSNGVNYAAWHEYAEKPHFVPFEHNGQENQPIKQWAKQKGIYSKTYGVTVTPTSFMEPGVSKAIRKTRRRLRRGDTELNSTLQRVFGS